MSVQYSTADYYIECGQIGVGGLSILDICRVRLPPSIPMPIHDDLTESLLDHWIFPTPPYKNFTIGLALKNVPNSFAIHAFSYRYAHGAA